MNNEYAVVGGGLGGLTAAVALAQQGRKVTLFEQSKKIGGRAQTETRAGFHLNLGPHALYRNGPAYRTLREWCIPFSGKTPVVKSHSYLTARGELYPFPADALRLFLSSAFRGTEKLTAARAFQVLLTTPSSDLTVDQWLDAKLKPGRARQFAEALIRVSTYSNQFDRLSAREASRQVQTGIKSGVLYLDGGWETIVAGLAAKAEALGVRMEKSREITQLEPEWAGVVLAVPPRSVEQLTGVELAHALIPIRAACLDLALKSLPAQVSIFALGLDQPMYFSRHTAVAALAPEGSSLVHVAKYLKDGEKAEAQELEGELKRYADLVMPGWRDHLEFTRFLPSLTVSHAVWTPAGRPGVDAIGKSGIAIAGDWVGDEGMLADAAVASALKAAESVMMTSAGRIACATHG